MSIHRDDPPGGGATDAGAIHGIAISPVEAPLKEGGPPLVVVHVAAPARFGGLERVVAALAAGQAARGHRVHVAAVLDAGTGDGHPFVASLGGTGVTVHAIEVAPRAYGRERAAMRALFGRLRPDVVHTHGSRVDVLHGLAAQTAGAAAVSTVHGFTGGGWKNRWYERLQRRALRRHDAVVAVSRAMVPVLARSRIAAERIEVIPNAWAPSAAPMERGEARRALGLSPGDFAVGWVGRVSPEKGLDVAIDALPLLASLPLRLVVMGDGPARAAMERRAHGCGVADRVDFRGAVPEAGRWMPAFDAWALSSRTEGTPVTLFEAVAAGVPVVAAAVGGVPDVVGEAEAILVPPEDPEALAAALRAVHASPLAAAARAERARERVAARFSAASWLRAHDDLYRRALRGVRTPSRR